MEFSEGKFMSIPWLEIRRESLVVGFFWSLSTSKVYWCAIFFKLSSRLVMLMRSSDIQ